MSSPCTYCGCDVAAHDPVAVYEGVDGSGSPDARFCNYGCLAAHVEEAGLTEGTSCRWPAEPS